GHDRLAARTLSPMAHEAPVDIAAGYCISDHESQVCSPYEPAEAVIWLPGVGSQGDHLILDRKAEGWRSQAVDANPSIPQVHRPQPIGAIVPGIEVVVQLQGQPWDFRMGQDGVVMRSAGRSYHSPLG